MCTTTAVAQPHAAGYVRPHDQICIPTTDVAVETGAFEADWDNLSAWSCPDWFRDAKFGIWAHWDPQCEAEDGDWYARSMYGENSSQWNTFTNYFGHSPSHDWGYKDFCRYWTISQWDPATLIDLYYAAGARYFMAMGQHHDNYDCWDSPYQEWNSMNIGPQRDVVGEWAQQCRRVGMRLGVSMHGAHAWTFFEVGRNYDTAVTKDEGTGTWWEGYDPQELYAQDHDHSANWSNWSTIHSQWHWGNGVCPPSVKYMQKFQNRVLQCINAYNPDMLYFDDTVLPFYGATTNTNDQYSLNILKHFYNHSANQHSGQQDVVVTGKILEDKHKQAMVWDVERGIPDRCQELPWQTCTCIGGWHYSKYDGDNNRYKQADQVIRMLVDIVSKNGNLLLSIPVRGNGSLDNNELNIIAGIKAWMDINKTSIY
ncbi:MAG: alpha-L-fucosidase, partial [Bacteroidaceae bacterium]|nr:alpha-L-fucosidase [Bacteroidaceae bacterium]